MIHSEEFPSPTRRSILNSILIAIIAILMVRLIQLQIIYHQEFGKKSIENSVRMLVREPIRGFIYDRKGRLLVDVGPSYSITVTPFEFKRENTTLLSNLLGIATNIVEDRINKGKSYSSFAPARIARDVNFTALAGIEEYITILDGVSYQVESKRVYPSSVRASHLLGYVKEISEYQLSRSRALYQYGDMIGSAGIESSYETFLRGQKGYEFVAVNAQGQVIGKINDGKSDIPSKEGFDLILSIDLDLQFTAESSMVGKRGAVVAIDPNTGGILALVSAPDFNPEIFSGLTRADDWSKLMNDESKPLFNRATLTRYPPGSTFKMVLAAAALEEKLIDEKTTVQCGGALFFGNRLFKDLHVHGTTNTVQAIQRSCNVFFYKLILKVGFDKWSEYGKKFGFGMPTQIDIGEETAGLLPSTEYYNRVYGEGRWTQGYVVSLSVGQGEIGVSPLQMAVYAATLANGGIIHQPHTVSSILNKRTNKVEVVEHNARRLEVSDRTMAIIREGLRRVVQEPGGTGSMARIHGIQSGGKTGTAQNPHGKDHAWYIGFAPFEHPKIAVAVLIENAGFGGAIAAPIAKRVIERYLQIESVITTVPTDQPDSTAQQRKSDLALH
jgi:penicillin-binding protein 2